MTIRRRLAFSFLAILLLFGLNLVIYFWSNKRREATVVDLQKAISRQNLLASINQRLSETFRLLALLTPMGEEKASPMTPEAIAQFNARLADIGKNIRDLRQLSDSQARATMELFDHDYQELSAAWRFFYANLGRNDTKAITELAVHGDPLSQKLIQVLLPKLQQGETQEVKAAGDEFYRVARLTDQITIIIFAISTIVAFVVALRVSRYLAHGFSQLKEGAAVIGSGQLDHRVDIASKDELGDLAQAFNNMAFEMLLARMNLTETNKQMERRNEELQQQKQVSESLLLNILPVQVAAELQAKGTVEPKHFEDVTIIFTDFVGFTLSTEKLAAEDLVYILHDYFTAFDEIIARYRLEKLKTIGDSYMCVGGMPVRKPTHAVDAVMAAFEMVRAVQELDQAEGAVHWTVRIGIHTGSVVAGVVGIQKFAFDIWGDAVNYASRMESSGAPNRINLSERTFSRVKDFFECEHRGKVMTKDKKELDMYFVNGIVPKLVDDPTKCPPPAFLRRYRAYFQSDPPAFPAFLLEVPSSRLQVSS